MNLKSFSVFAGLIFATQTALSAPFDKSSLCERMLANFSPRGAAPGAVVAAPSTANPDYYYHWVRDASIAIKALVELHADAKTQVQRDRFFEVLSDYVNFSRGNQLSAALSNLGEPKFYVDGKPYDKPWGRPQNDGPALRALAMIEFADTLLNEGKNDYVREKLYAAELPAHRLIKADLEYVSHHWRDTSFDAWEEWYGDHFFTRMVQRRALLDGARLARKLGDPGAADWYEEQATLLSVEVEKHWDPSAGIIRCTLGVGSAKAGGLDTAVLLGALLGGTGDGFYDVTSDRVLSTAQKIKEKFQMEYKVNKLGYSGVAIGRYPNDVYYGGNPWVLTTLAFAELYYRAASAFEARRTIEVTALNVDFLRDHYVKDKNPRDKVVVGQRLNARSEAFRAIVSGLREAGDAFVERVKFHANADGSLSEQIDRDTGYMKSAPALTWNYAAFLNALRVRSGK